MTTEPKLPPMPLWPSGAINTEKVHEWGLQCFEAGRPQWQPIETAPKDGAWILLGYFPDVGGNHVIVACWDRYRSLWLTPYVTLGAEGHFSPTHWMPLPQPPKA